MTGKLIALNIKALFTRMFLRSRNQKKRNPAVTILIILLAIYVFASMMFLFGTIFYQLNRLMFPMDLGWFYFSFMGIGIFAFCFAGSIFAAQAQLFSAKDNELLLSLPIKPRAILAGRLASLLLLEYLFAAVFALPAFVIWLVFQPVTAAGVLFFIIAVLTLPLASLALASFFAWLIALVTSRLHNKNALTLILSLVFMGLYFYVFSNLNSHINQLIMRGEEIAAAVRQSLFPIYHMGIAIEQGSFLSLLIYLICIIAPFVIMLLVLSANFIRIAAANRGAARIKYTEKALKVSNVRTAFVKKELRHFFGNPMYMLNSALGGVFMVVGAGALVVKRDVALSFIEQLNQTGIALSPVALVCAVLGMISALNLVSAPSVSLEGKNLWIAKSLPVLPIDVLMAKVQMHLLVCGIPAAVASIISAVALQANPLEFFLILAVPLLMTYLMALFGVVINLHFPKFDWINELQPIKQGVSVLLSMFGAFALVAALAVLYVFILSSIVNIELYLTLCAALFAVLSGTLYGYLRIGGSRRFEALTN
jgi:ABC-2 type transport system permease protein